MDLSCLIGLCSAAAQETGAVAAPLAQGAAAVPGSAPTPEAGWLETIGLLATLLGVISVMLAQILAPWVIRRYARRMEALMRASSPQAPGPGGTIDRPAWTADALLAAMERQRRMVLRLLIGVVLVYSAVAAAVLIAHTQTAGTKLSALSVAVSFLMFASFSGPVVLLGVSAANFARLFWTWFAPATFAAVAMQSMLASVSNPEEQRSHVLWALAAVAVLTAVAVALRHAVPAPARQQALLWLRRHWLLGVLGALLLVLVAVALLFIALPDSAGYLLGGSLAGALAIGLCYLTMVDRIRRIVAPLLAAGMFTLVAATLGVLVAGWSNPDKTALAILLAVPPAALVLGVLAASFMLSWIGLAYEQKVFSDAQFQVFCWMITVAGVVICVGTLVRESSLFDPMNLWLLSATAVALAVYWLVTRYGIRPLDSNKRLLVLRVFSKERRGERLLDELEYGWRFIGPIVLIGATDVAKRTIDPAKAADFLRRRMEDIFVPSLHVLHKRVAAMDETPDPDGRYRVNEFFCFDNTWREAVRRLLDSSDAIVLDLSEFTAGRAGTAWELGQLRERGALPRTVFLVSDQTDLDAVCAALHLPPGAELPAGAVLRVDASLDGAQVIEALVRRIPEAPARPEGAPAATAPAPGAP
jgi:hypothetical protein